MSMQYSWATRTPDFVLTLSDTDAMRSASGSHSSEENLFFPVSAHVALVCLLWMYPQCDDVGFLIIFMGESYLLHSKHINLIYFILPSLCQCSPNVSESYQKPNLSLSCKCHIGLLTLDVRAHNVTIFITFNNINWHMH